MAGDQTMTPRIVEIFHLIMSYIVPSLQRNEGVLLVVAGFMLLNALLYGITRGKEFAIGGYASVLFIYPFIQFS
jgi:hypothetical protein